MVTEARNWLLRPPCEIKGMGNWAKPSQHRAKCVQSIPAVGNLTPGVRMERGQEFEASLGSPSKKITG